MAETITAARRAAHDRAERDHGPRRLQPAQRTSTRRRWSGWRRRCARPACCSRCSCSPPRREGEFELVDGERRYRAAFQAGLTEIPVLVRPRETDTGGLLGALTANFHRAAHTPVEEAHAFARLLDGAA